MCVAGVAARFGLVAGSSLDLTDGWDFNRPDHRMQSLRRIEHEEQFCVIGSPPSTKCSLFQELAVARRWNVPIMSKKHERELDEARCHIDCCCLVYCY